MALGARPLGSRSLGDSAGEALPRPAAAAPVQDLSTAGSWQWNMPGVSTPGGGLGWSNNVVSNPPQSLSGADTGSGVDSQSLVVTRSAVLETGVGAEGQALSVSMTRADTAVAAEAESLFIPAVVAYAYIYENTITDPAKEGAAFASIFENVTTLVPTPHVWHLAPAAGLRGQVITIVGMGFGSTATQYEGYVTLGAGRPPAEAWRSIAPGANALSSNRSINSAQDTVDPGHDRIDFRIPQGITSADVRVYLNAPDIIVIPDPPIFKADDDFASAVETNVLTILVEQFALGQQATGT